MLLVTRDPLFAQHDPGRGHPERPERLTAVLEGLQMVDPEACRDLPARPAERADLERVHSAQYLDALAERCGAGGGHLDADTAVCPRSYDAAVLAAGAGLAAVDALRAGDAVAAFLAVRPPGHHAVPSAAMGFCLINNVAVTAAALAAAGERVMVVDWDAHHGNGTQDIFWSDPAVCYVSLHEWPLYPGTGRLRDLGSGAAEGTTVNVPLPAGATGDVYLAAFDEVIAPVASRFRPDWILVSAGYDAHRLDPLTGLALSAGDFVDLTDRVRDLAPGPGRVVVFLEGGYDLHALRDGVAATASALLGQPARPEPPTSGGPGREMVVAAARVHSAG